VQHVTVRVPASTSNLGPGFDCLGVALCLYSEVTVRRVARARHNTMVQEAAAAFFSATRRNLFDFSCTIAGDVPVARGLGSSATIRVGLLSALNELARTNLSRRAIFAIAAELENHPDNAAPATFGGFTVTRRQSVQRFAIASRLFFVLLIPPFEVATERARAILPKMIPREDAVRSAGIVAAITAAFASRKYESLRGNFFDGLHQPYRKQLVPHLADCVAAAERAGALGAFLSGSGSAVCAVTLRDPQKIGVSMLQESICVNARLVITRADNNGAQLVRAHIGNRESQFPK
jgi:homoserine kinase